jgi:hypothetical protein
MAFTLITGSRAQTRTGNLPVNSRTLCRLSYAGSADEHLARARCTGTFAAHKGSVPGAVPGPDGRTGRVPRRRQTLLARA